MENAVVQRIRKRITRSKFGEVFFVSSFPQYDAEYVTKLLAKFEKEGLITRIAKGVYVKARKTRFGILYPSAFELVTEIAKRDKAKVIPTGATAENRLGFSTQVPMNTIFLTTASGRKLKLGNRTVTLKHGAPNITSEVEARIGQLFAETPEADTIEYDLLLAPVWMRQTIKKGIRQ